MSTTNSTTWLEATTLGTPAGGLSVIVAGEVVVAAGFAPVDAMAARLSGPVAGSLAGRGLRERRDLGSVSRAVLAYLAGDLAALDAVEVDQPGAGFTQEVWRLMREIPAGSTWTYAELATKAGRPAAVRAVGNACARNLVAPFVPCHRVLRTGGGLGGYYYGLPVKQWLLAHESGSLGGQASTARSTASEAGRRPSSGGS
jgi:methylated-DNA-[protein]-cysteine S-methyltransferase